MLKVAVVGNCQTVGIARSLNALSSEIEATSVAFLDHREDAAREDAARGLHAFDMILAHNYPREKVGALASDALAERYPHLIPLPMIHFSGLHPDWYPMLLDGKIVHTPAENFHSCIVAAAFANGIPEARVMGLFNSYIFARLGYFDQFALSRSLFLERAANEGYDFGADLESWRAAGIFMHTLNHPKIHVLADIARRVAEKLGLLIDGDAGATHDALERHAGLPVYPPLAERIGVPAGWTIRCARKLTATISRLVPMETYVTETYEIYRGLPRAFFDQPELQKARAVLAEEVL